MVHETTVERVTNRVWGIFSSLDHGIAGNNDRRALLRAYIASLAERGEHNADKLTVDGLVYSKNLTSHQKKPVCTENFIRVDDAPESPKLAE